MFSPAAKRSNTSFKYVGKLPVANKSELQGLGRRMCSEPFCEVLALLMQSCFVWHNGLTTIIMPVMVMREHVCMLLSW